MSERSRRVQIAVSGPGDASPEAIRLAEAVGRGLGERGATVVCGGLDGCMEAVCRGARAAGGSTVGIIPGYEARSANAHLDIVICSGMGQARNALVVASGSAVIAIAGGAGTLSEVALAIRLGRPVVLLGDWPDALVEALVPLASAGAVHLARDADQAVEIALAVAG